MDIGYSHIFFPLFAKIRKLQRNTYLNPCSEFILNFLDIIYPQMTPICKHRSYLNSNLCSNLCLSDYALFINHDRGYAELKALVGCV